MMPTRFDIKPKSRYGIKGLSTGYDGLKGSTLEIPPCGIVDVDRSLFDLFNVELPLHVTTNEGVKRVPIVFGSMEKWAAIKKNKGLRDENGSLILPLITIVKTDISQTHAKDIAGRGTNQHTGELLVKRRLDKKDRNYQNLLNKLLIKNQTGVAVSSGVGTDSDIITDRDVGSLLSDPTINDGGYLKSDVGNNIFEILAIPTPQYMTFKYEVTIWTQFQQQMNEIIESIVSSYMPQVRGWKIETQKGYWFVANVISDEFQSEDNFDDMSKQERIMKRKFLIEVPAFILVSDSPGTNVAIKRYVSNPIVSFGVSVSDGISEPIGNNSVVFEPFLGADDPTLPQAVKSRRDDMRDTGIGNLRVDKNHVSTEDPALSTFKRGQKKSKWKKFVLQDSAGNKFEKFVRVKSYNAHTGEMVLNDSGFDLGGLMIVSIDD